MKRLFKLDEPFTWMAFGFVVWVFAFWGFLTDRLSLLSDALSYYEHTKFFVSNLSHGVFPLWDPFWFHGASNDFFLRRIGAFNPFYLFPLIINSIGIPFNLAYLWSLAFYFLSGAVALFLLAMRLYNNRLLAYAGFLLFLFSALGTRLFDAYMMLITIPLMWFFYCLTAFVQTPRRHLFLRAVLSTMVLLGTYIPFYFICFMVLTCGCFCVFYADRLGGMVKIFRDFFDKNKLLVIGSVLALILSILPLLLFYHQSSSGNVVLPLRHGKSEGSTLVVPKETINWGAVEDVVFSGFFTDLTRYKFAIIYVPFFAVIVFALGLMGKITRRMMFLCAIFLVLSVCIVPYGLPFYNFLYDHVGMLKYFRNLHFFIWFMLLPLFLLLVLEHWSMFENIERRRGLAVWVVGVHCCALVFMVMRADAIMSSYVMLILSLMFWLMWLKKAPLALLFGLLTATVVVQPLEVYHYLTLNAQPRNFVYDYSFPLNKIHFNDHALVGESIQEQAVSDLYYASGSYNLVYKHTNPRALSVYLQNKFVLVDKVIAMNPKEADMAFLSQLFLSGENSAVVFSQDPRLKTASNDPNPPPKALGLSQEKQWFKVESFDANTLRLAVDIPFEKFLVYNDSHDVLWRAYVNGKQVPLYQANGAFKGVWIPSGKCHVEFKYGTWPQFLLNWSLLIVAVLLLMGIVVGVVRQEKGIE